MRPVLLVLVTAVLGIGGAPAAACPVDEIEGAAVIAAPGGTGPNPTVFLDIGSALEPWRIKATGTRGDGTAPVAIDIEVRRLPGTTLATTDIPFDAGYVDLWMTDGGGFGWRSSHFYVHIDAPAAASAPGGGVRLLAGRPGRGAESETCGSRSRCCSWRC